MTRIVMVASECVPFAKTGGLGDVIGALPVQLEKLGLDVTVVLPRYQSINLQEFQFQPYPIEVNTVPLGWETIPFDVHRSRLPGSSVKVFLIGNDRFFGRSGIYVDPKTGKDYPDQADRWIFFDRAAMEFLRTTTPEIDILHCHDQQTGLIPAYLRKLYRAFPVFNRTKSVFSIHNLGYQGLFSREVMWRTGFNDAEFYPTSPFEFYGSFNLMKVGLCYADVITTVSRTYAREIQESNEYGYGLEGLLRERSADVVGIVNGIDDKDWNPAADPWIPEHFSRNNLEGKRKNKRALLREFGLAEKIEKDDEVNLDWPVLAMISRIDVQKGFDLLVTILDYLLSRDLYFVLLGTGNKETEAYLQTIVERHRSKASIRFAFEVRLSHLVEAGADMLLMPSKYEPCGLNQMYSMNYGTVPIVRATGGLADTVQEFDPVTRAGTGFRFDRYDADEFRAAIDKALDLWPNRASWLRLMKNGMQKDFSWLESAKRYVDLYKSVQAAP